MSKIMIDQGYWEAGHPVLDGYDKFTKEMIGIPHWADDQMEESKL